MSSPSHQIQAVLGAAQKLPGWTVSWLDSGNYRVTSPTGMMLVPGIVKAEDCPAVLSQLDDLGLAHDRDHRFIPEVKRHTEKDSIDVPTTPAKTDVPDPGPGRPKATWRKTSEIIRFDFPTKPQNLPLEQILPDAYKGQKRCMVPRVRIGIEAAHELFALRAAEHNRKLRRSNVARFKRLILDGQFDPTHQGIAFNTRGECADGQHRLCALIEAAEEDPKLTIVVDITYNAPVDHAKSYDGGANRTAVDRLNVAGVENASRVAPLIRLLYTYEQAVEHGIAWRDVDPLSQVDLLDWADKYGADLVEAYEAVRRPLKRTFMPANVAAVCHYLAREHWENAPIDDFIDALAEPTRLTADSPQRALSNWLVNNTDKKRSPQMFMAMFLIAYRDFCEGNERRQMKWLPSTGMPTPYSPDN